MRITYSKDVESLYFQLKNSEIVDSEEIDPGIVYDYDRDDNIVGVEVLRIRKRTLEQMKHITSAFSEKEIDVLQEFLMEYLFGNTSVQDEASTRESFLVALANKFAA